jgi:hypothetical protein
MEFMMFDSRDYYELLSLSVDIIGFFESMGCLDGCCFLDNVFELLGEKGSCFSGIPPTIRFLVCKSLTVY